MQRDRKRKATEGGYTYVSDDMRKALLDLINHNPKMTLKDAAKHSGIKYSTAKTIKRVYLKEKRMTKKPNPRRSKVKLRKIAKRKKIFLVHHLTCYSTVYEIQRDSESKEEKVGRKMCKNKKKRSKNARNLKFKTLREKKINFPSQAPKSEEKKSDTKEREICSKDILKIYELLFEKGVLESQISRNQIDLMTLNLTVKYVNCLFSNNSLGSSY